MRVKFFGGPAHGDIREVDAPRVAIPDRRRIRRFALDEPFDPSQHISLPISTYTIQTLEERRASPIIQRISTRFLIRRYTVHRRLEIALIDGINTLLPHEHTDLERELSGVAWTWDTIPSILDWDDWWRWQVWKRRLDDEWCRCADRFGPWFDALEPGGRLAVRHGLDRRQCVRR